MFASGFDATTATQPDKKESKPSSELDAKVIPKAWPISYGQLMFTMKYQGIPLPDTLVFDYTAVNQFQTLGPAALPLCRAVYKDKTRRGRDNSFYAATMLKSSLSPFEDLNAHKINFNKYVKALNVNNKDYDFADEDEWFFSLTEKQSQKLWDLWLQEMYLAFTIFGLPTPEKIVLDPAPKANNLQPLFRIVYPKSAKEIADKALTEIKALLKEYPGIEKSHLINSLKTDDFASAGEWFFSLTPEQCEKLWVGALLFTFQKEAGLPNKFLPNKVNLGCEDNQLLLKLGYNNKETLEKVLTAFITYYTSQENHPEYKARVEKSIRSKALISNEGHIILTIDQCKIMCGFSEALKKVPKDFLTASSKFQSSVLSKISTQSTMLSPSFPLEAKESTIHLERVMSAKTMGSVTVPKKLSLLSSFGPSAPGLIANSSQATSGVSKIQKKI